MSLLCFDRHGTTHEPTTVQSYQYFRTDAGVFATQPWRDYSTVVQSFVPVRALLKVSESSVTPKASIRTLVKWVPKIPLKEPKAPVLYEPRLPVLKERRPDQSNGSWNRALTLYRKIYKEASEKRLKNYRRWLRRSAQYEKRRIKYLQNLDAATNGIMSYRRPLVSCDNRPWHPFRDLRTEYSPPIGRSIVQYGPLNGYGAPCFPVTYSSIGSITDEASVEYQMGQLLRSLSDHFDQVERQAESLALRRLKDAMFEQKAHIGNLIAERHQSLEMLSNLFKRALKLLSLGKLHKQVKILPGTAKEVSNDFLAFQFGLRPLMQDIYALVKEISKQTTPLMVYHVKGSAKVKLKDHVTRFDSLSAGLPLNVRIDDDYTGFLTVRYALEYSIDNPTLATLQSYGLVNPLEIAWEVLPWSFVVDWFLPVGAFIRDLNANSNVTFVRGTRSVVFSFETSTHVVCNKQHGPGWDSYGDVRTVDTVSAGRVYDKERVILTNSPIDARPVLKNPISMYHLLETLALIIQRFR